MLSTGRNNPCPCGSQKKYKQCCLKSDAREHISDSITNQLRTALQLQQSGNIRQAEAIYHQVLQNSPNHPDALHLLGLLARQEGNYQQAVDLIAKAAKILTQDFK
jgi:cytochrome c-type biogenesis protein CcmH/NrfG